jgi:protein Mpv17
MEGVLPGQTARKGSRGAPQRNVYNTAIKVLLDQTVLAWLNTYVFVALMTLMRGATTAQALQHAWADVWGIMRAGLSMWPMVSLAKFSLLDSAESRSILEGCATIVWVVYLGMIQGGSSD